MAALKDSDRTIDRTVCLTGPESTGKTALAVTLVERLGGTLVREVARDYLQVLEIKPDDSDPYGPDDLLEIVQQQIALETHARSQGGLVVCDTDVLVMQIWWQEKFGALPESLRLALAQRSPRFYLLLSPDLPWVADRQRENPQDRQRLFERYRVELEASSFPYAVVAGEGEQRVECALRAIDQWREPPRPIKALADAPAPCPFDV